MDKLSKAIQVLEDQINYSVRNMDEVSVELDFETADVILELLKEQEAMNVDSFVQWCIDNHIAGDATVQGIKYWVGKFKERR